MNRSRTAAAGTRTRVLQLLILVAAAWTAEVNAEAYVILSLVGDHVTIVSQGSQVGSHLDQNRYEVVKLVEPQLDDFAVSIADAVLAKAQPAASVVRLRANDPKLYALRDSWLDAEAVDVRELLALIGDGIPVAPDRHLLLITPYRDQPQLKTSKAELGSGKVSGLGFYVDTATYLYRADTHEKSRGYLGIFANFQLVLINLQSGAVEGHERVVLGTTRSSARAEDRTPWNALTGAQKTKVLESLMKEGIETSLPRVLSSKKQ